MKLVDLSYLKNNMTSIEEIEVENYQHILKFTDNFNMEKGIVNLDFLGLPQLEIGNIDGHLNFSIGDTVCLLAYVEDDLKYYANYFANKNDVYEEDVIEFIKELEVPCVITPTPLNIIEKEAAYHIFMTLKKY